MPDARPPTVRARQLARELRECRFAAGLTGEQAAAELGWSAAKLSRIETARSGVTVADVKRLLGLFQISETQGDRLVDLARSAQRRGWWESIASLPEDYRTYLGLEDEASFLRSFRLGPVNGLLQTEQYARAIIRNVVPRLPPGEIEQAVEVRLKRQARLLGPNPLKIWTVLEESVIRRLIGGPEVAREQLAHLLTVCEMANVTIQILPFTKGAHPSLGFRFNILSFHEDLLPDVVHIEEMTGDIFIENEKRAFRYMLAFEEIQQRALSEQESREFIAQAIDDIDELRAGQ
ncbi:helix-turn-helix domain-containing protein [Spirillospora sp. CA-294931]|uniref:helix-turn-helix domain-containing protein n=1 Tax=Spirillospora sp. CA-294931 TaxID=3240042 RepID=UPI003D8C4AB0